MYVWPHDPQRDQGIEPLDESYFGTDSLSPHWDLWYTIVWTRFCWCMCTNPKEQRSHCELSWPCTNRWLPWKNFGEVFLGFLILITEIAITRLTLQNQNIGQTVKADYKNNNSWPTWTVKIHHKSLVLRMPYATQLFLALISTSNQGQVE